MPAGGQEDRLLDILTTLYNMYYGSLRVIIHENGLYLPTERSYAPPCF